MRKPFTTIVAVLLLIVAVAQAFRAVSGLEVLIDGYTVPLLASWIAAGVALFLSLTLFREARS